MKPQRKRRLVFIICLILSASIALALALFALNQNINLFLTPSSIVAGKAPLHQQQFRIGGVVKKGSVKHGKNLDVRFILTDPKHPTDEVKIFYNGILPTLFREGQEIIADGYLNHHGTFIATQVLAKHDETYTPRMR